MPSRCREVVTHESDGLRVPVKDAKALAGTIERLPLDAALRCRRGRRREPRRWPALTNVWSSIEHWTCTGSWRADTAGIHPRPGRDDPPDLAAEIPAGPVQALSARRAGKLVLAGGAGGEAAVERSRWCHEPRSGRAIMIFPNGFISVDVSDLVAIYSRQGRFRSYLPDALARFPYGFTTDTC